MRECTASPTLTVVAGGTMIEVRCSSCGMLDYVPRAK